MDMSYRPCHETLDRFRCVMNCPESQFEADIRLRQPFRVLHLHTLECGPNFDNLVPDHARHFNCVFRFGLQCGKPLARRGAGLKLVDTFGDLRSQISEYLEYQINDDGIHNQRGGNTREKNDQTSFHRFTEYTPIPRPKGEGAAQRRVRGTT